MSKRTSFDPIAWLAKAGALGYSVYSTLDSGVVFQPKQLRAMNGAKDGTILKEFNDYFDSIALYLSRNHQA